MRALPTKDESVKRYHLYRGEEKTGFTLPLFPSEAMASNDRMRALGHCEEWRERVAAFDVDRI